MFLQFTKNEIITVRTNRTIRALGIRREEDEDDDDSDI